MNYSNIPGVPDFKADEYAARKTKYCILIPIINESERIANELQRAKTAGIHQLCDIIICDGGSTDGGTEAKKLRSLEVNTLLTKTGPGKQGAQLRMGIWFALERGYEGIITIDGNDKDSIEDIPSFTKKLDQGYDFVQGSRFIKGGKAINTPLIRYLSVRFIHAPIISLTAKKWFTDTTNAFRAYSKKYLTHPEVKPLRDVFVTYELLAYLSVRANQLSLKTCEIPVTRKYPAKGKTPTKISFFKGNGGLLQILFTNLFGGYNPKPRQLNVFNWLGGGLILGSAICFMYALFIGNDFWIDEAMAVQAIFTRNISELAASPLDYSQNAPLGYVYIVKLFSIIFGETTVAARLPAVLAAFGTMFVAYRIGKDLIKSRSPLFYAGAISLSSIFFSYATQAKQYTFESMSVLLVIWLGGIYWQGKIKPILLAPLFALITWFSFASVFFMFTTIAIILLSQVYEIARGKLSANSALKSSAPFIITLISVLLNLLLWILPSSSAMTNEAQDYWDKLAFPLLPTSFEDIKLMLAMLSHLLRPLNIFGLVLLILSIAYAPLIFDRGKDMRILIKKNMLAIYAALIIGLLASYLGYLPMQDRIWIFMYPLIMIGIVWVCEHALSLFTSKSLKTVYLTAVVLVFVLNLAYLSQQKQYIRPGQQLSASMKHLESHELREDIRYVSYSATPQYNYLTDYNQHFSNHLLQGVAVPGTIYGSRIENTTGEGAYQYEFTPIENRLDSDVETIAENERVWLLFAHIIPNEDVNNPQWQLLEKLEDHGTVTLKNNEHNTPLYLFEKNDET